MKKISLKIKVTLMFTFFMTLLTCISLGLLFSLSSQEILGSVQAQLEKRVYESMDEVSVQNGKLDMEQDFYDLEDGIYLALYDETGTFLFGRALWFSGKDGVCRWEYADCGNRRRAVVCF